MRLLILAALLGAAVARPAAADVAPCQVTFRLIRVPQEVKSLIDTWLRSEQTCGVPLEVSIEGVDDGYVVNARDGRGGLRVRTVPDAETLAVLIVSWSADDQFALVPSAVASAPAATDAPRVTPPGMTRVQAAPAAAVLGHAGERPGAGSGRRMLLAGLWGSVYGVRGEIDGFGRRVPIGVALEAESDGYQSELHAVVYIGIAGSLGGWRMRAQLGTGLFALRRPVTNITPDSERWWDPGVLGADPIFEASIQASHALGRRWAVTAGVLFAQRISVDWIGNGNTDLAFAQTTGGWLIGASRAL